MLSCYKLLSRWNSLASFDRPTTVLHAVLLHPQVPWLYQILRLKIHYCWFIYVIEKQTLFTKAAQSECPSLSTIYPIAAMRRFLSLRGLVSGPLFTFQQGSLLIRTVMSNLLVTCLPGNALDTYSFRIGGASALFSEGLPDATLQILDKWTSKCFSPLF